MRDGHTSQRDLTRRLEDERRRARGLPSRAEEERMRRERARRPGAVSLGELIDLTRGAR